MPVSSYLSLALLLHAAAAALGLLSFAHKCARTDLAEFCAAHDDDLTCQELVGEARRGGEEDGRKPVYAIMLKGSLRPKLNYIGGTLAAGGDNDGGFW